VSPYNPFLGQFIHDLAKFEHSVLPDNPARCPQGPARKRFAAQDKQDSRTP
jgi:hypothetical protein